jgi:hypothetical protein
VIAHGDKIEKFAVILLGLSTATVSVLLVPAKSPDQLLNPNPPLGFGFAVNETDSPESYQALEGVTVPPTTGTVGRTVIVR